MAMGKWQSAVFGALYNKTDDEDKAQGETVAGAGRGTAEGEEALKTDKSGKAKWQQSILNAIYGDSAEAKEQEAALTKEQQAEAKADPVAVAERIFAKAESKRNSVLGVLGSFAGGGEILAETEELYLTAAYKFKMAAKWDRAGLSYANAAKMAHCIGHFHTETLHLTDAAKCYKRVDPEEAIKCLQVAVDLLIDTAKYARAGTVLQWMAEIYEDIQDLKMAGETYAQAAEYFREEGVRNGSAAKCLLKTADYVALEGEYRRAIDIYEQIGVSRADHHLLKWGAKDIYFKSALLHLCTGDVVIARAAIERYEDQHPAFEGCRENVLVKRLVDATEDNDLVAFDAAVKQYEKITEMTPWTQTHVNTIRKALQDDEVDLR